MQSRLRVAGEKMATEWQNADRDIARELVREVDPVVGQDSGELDAGQEVPCRRQRRRAPRL